MSIHSKALKSSHSAVPIESWSCRAWLSRALRSFQIRGHQVFDLLLLQVFEVSLNEGAHLVFDLTKVAVGLIRPLLAVLLVDLFITAFNEPL